MADKSIQEIAYEKLENSVECTFTDEITICKNGLFDKACSRNCDWLGDIVGSCLYFNADVWQDETLGMEFARCDECLKKTGD